jgi:hypothetical protein
MANSGPVLIEINFARPSASLQSRATMAPMALDTIDQRSDALQHQTRQSIKKLAEDPLSRTWRGDKAGTLRLSQNVPVFGDNMEELHRKRQWVKEHMAAAFQFWGKLGFGEGVSGHITVRDPVKPDHYW